MKTLTLLAFSTSLLAAPLYAQEDVSQLSEKVTMRDGTFWPKHETDGKNYFRGQWHDNVVLFGAGGHFDEETALLSYAQSLGFNNLNDLAKYFGYFDPNNMPLGDVDALDAYLQNHNYFEEGSMEGLLTAWNYNSAEQLALDWGFLDLSTGAGSFQDWSDNEGGIGGIMNNNNIPIPRDQFLEGNFTDAVFASILGNIGPYLQNEINTFGYAQTIFSLQDTGDAEAINAFIQSASNADIGENKQGVLRDIISAFANYNSALIPGVNTQNLNLSGFDTSIAGLQGVRIGNLPLSDNQINATNNLSYADFGTRDVSGINWNGKDVIGVNLSQVQNLDLEALKDSLHGYRGLNLSGQDLSNLNVTGITTFTGANLSGTGITAAQIQQLRTNVGSNEVITGANLSGINLTSLNTADFRFSGTNLTGTGLTGAQLSVSSPFFTQANLSGLNLTGFPPPNFHLGDVNFTGATGLTPTALTQSSSLQRANFTGTGITRAALEAALISAGKNINHSNYNLNLMVFD